MNKKGLWIFLFLFFAITSTNSTVINVSSA